MEDILKSKCRLLKREEKKKDQFRWLSGDDNGQKSWPTLLTCGMKWIDEVYYTLSFTNFCFYKETYLLMKLYMSNYHDC